MLIGPSVLPVPMGRLLFGRLIGPTPDHPVCDDVLDWIFEVKGGRVHSYFYMNGPHLDPCLAVKRLSLA